MKYSVLDVFKDILPQMLANSQKQHVISEENVFQEGNTPNRQLFMDTVSKLMKPGSGVRGVENLVELYQKAQEGRSCLLLMEHYSNFDLPNLFYLLGQAHPQGTAIGNALVAIAGFKLNEEDSRILAFAEAFTRIIIYPSRSIEALPDSPEKEAELKRAQRINLAAMKALNQAKKDGKIVLVFPAGTRYRPGRPETKRGVKEIDSYIKGFDCMCLVGINGLTLETRGGTMLEDQCMEDVIMYTASPVIDCTEFRKTAQAECPEDQDSKQFTVDRVMSELDKLHESTEVERVKLLTALKK